MTESLAELLGTADPFDGLAPPELEAIAAASTLRDYALGEVVIDAFAEQSGDVFFVVSGGVELWTGVDASGPADDRLGPGGVFGYSAMLIESSIGPRVVASAPSRIAQIPGDSATIAFVTRKGARYLAKRIVRWSTSPRPSSVSAGVEDLLRAQPLVVACDATVADAARDIGADGRGYAAVRLPDGNHRLVTDASLRQRVIVDGVPGSAPVTEALDSTPPVAVGGDSAAELLLAMLDRGAQFVVVTDRDGALRGVVSLRDVFASPIKVDISLHERLRSATTVDDLVDRAHALPGLLGDLLASGLTATKVIAVNATMRDALVRRAIELTFADHPELSTDDFTLLLLGSHGRREAVLSSDIDSAVAFLDATPPATVVACRGVFAEIGGVLSRAGLAKDEHGTNASKPLFCRTNAEWRSAASDWIAKPEADRGAIMTSLMVDGRPIYGDPGLPPATAVIGDLRRHPGTLRLLLEDALARRARLRFARDALRLRPQRVDLKRDAILPVVNLARWAALSSGSVATGTVDRIRAAAGSPALPETRARSLIEVFEALAQIRLRYQLIQLEEGSSPADSVTMERMSPIDRSVVAQAVREVAAAQRRAANISNWVDTDELVAPPGR
ncbi:putative nucleotidyltransferase substrate binding domain-containing protein [Antrihabitans cavernicola]|uniref:CBS domain-containing protein n=1 Tax=Antrihabitans cavernicola TaxID=2495913 RepID=A0A5A7SDQ3_9NOCA|nr:putative nucleotidyltransferase substrate binding domain-containing protein [Spelaeibacter cavernicola]KAA0022877.1 CBS domain-containing protein [Spelaeibacter cavernicola]